MTDQDATPPQNIHQAIHAVKAALALHGIAKEGRNQDQKYAFRGVEQIINALSELFVQHRINVVPRITQVRSIERQTGNGKPMPASFVDAEFDLVSVDDGTLVTFKACGEGADMSDKGTNKAMSAAFKYAMTLGFVIPTQGVLDEGDVATPGADRDEPRQQRELERQQSRPSPRMVAWVDQQVKDFGSYAAPADLDQLNTHRDHPEYQKLRGQVQEADSALFKRLTDAERGAVERTDDVPF